MKWGPKGGILILVENGPPGFYLWCCGDHWHGFLTFIQIAHGHTVKMLKINFLNEAIIFLKMLKIANFNNIIFDFAQENKSVKNILVGIKIFQCNFKLVLAWFCTAFFFYDAPEYSLEVFLVSVRSLNHQSSFYHQQQKKLTHAWKAKLWRARLEGNAANWRIFAF